MTKKRTKNQDRGKKLSVEELVEHLIGKCMRALENKKLKVTVTDLIRIRAAREELAPMQPVGEVAWRDGRDSG